MLALRDLKQALEEASDRGAAEGIPGSAGLALNPKP